MNDNQTEKSTSIQTLSRESIIVFVGQIFRQLANFIFIVLVVRLVSQETYGIFTLSISIIFFTQVIFSLNLEKSIDYYLPKYLKNGEFRKAKGLFISILKLSLIFSTLGFITIILISDIISRLFSQPILRYILPLLAITIVLQSVNSDILHVFRGAKSLKYKLIIQDIIGPISKLFITIFLIYLSFDIYGLIIGYIISMMIVLVIGLLFIYNKFSWIDSPPIKISSRPLLSYSLPLVFVGVIRALLGQIDYFLLAGFQGADVVASYKVIYEFGSQLTIFMASVTPILKPIVSENVQSKSNIEQYYKLTTRWVTIFTIPVTVTLILESQNILRVIFTSEYASAYIAFIVLVIGYSFNSFMGPDGAMLQGLGYTRLNLLNSSIVLLLNILLNFILIPEYGIIGAAIATTSAFILGAVLGQLEIYLLMSIHPFSRELFLLWAGAFPATIGAIIVRSFTSVPVISILLSGLTSLVIFFIISFVGGGITEEDLQLAYTQLRNFVSTMNNYRN